LIALIGVGTFIHLNSEKTYTGKNESITIGLYPDFMDAPIYIANEQGFFTANGLNVTIKNYATGAAANDALQNDEVDIAVCSEFVMVNDAFQHENISIITSFDKSQRFYIICNKDAGVENVSDLEGKRIGFTKGTVTNFYLGRFIQLNGMNEQDVDLVNIQPSQIANAFLAGKIDATIADQSVVETIQQQDPNGIVIWPAQSSQSCYNVIIARNDWIKQHPELVRRFLKSMDQSENYLTSNPSQSKSIIGKQMNYTDSEVESMWPNHHFSLTLDESLILAMEDESRWEIANNLTNETDVPNFKDYISLKGLEEINPNSVSIF